MELFGNITRGDTQQPFPSGLPLKKFPNVRRKESFSRRTAGTIGKERYPKKSSFQLKFSRPKEPLYKLLYVPQLIHPRIKGLFSKEIPPDLKLAWRLNYFLMD